MLHLIRQLINMLISETYLGDLLKFEDTKRMNLASWSSIRNQYHEAYFLYTEKVITIISKAATIILVPNDYGWT